MSHTELTAKVNYDIVTADANFSVKRAKLFLQLLGETGRVAHAARLVGFLKPDALYARRKRDPEFRAAWNEALERAADIFEAEAVRRAVDGVDKDVYYKGEVVGQERVYSDGLLGKLMEGAKPEKYQKKAGDGVNVNVNVGLAVIPMTAPTEEDWEREAAAGAPEPEKIIEGQFTEIPHNGSKSVPMKVVRA